MTKYKNGKIYQLVCLNTNQIYVGSTHQKLCKRLSDHVVSYKGWTKKGINNYISSFKIIEGGNYRIELLEDYPCERKEQLHAKEGEYIKKLDCVNKNIPSRSIKEYYKDNLNKILEDKKQYYKDNKEKIIVYNKKYQIDNSVKVSERHKVYYKKNQKQLLTKAKEIYVCECGTILTKSHSKRHERTNKHKNYIIQKK